MFICVKPNSQLVGLSISFLVDLQERHFVIVPCCFINAKFLSSKRPINVY